MITRNLRITVILSSVILLLFIPLIAMQFSTEVNWTLSDFLVAGTLLIGTGIVAEFVLRKFKKPKSFILIGFAILALILIWAELAVGVFGSPFAGS